MKGPLDHITLDDLGDDCRLIAEIVGLKGLLAMAHKLGGEFVYLPKLDTLLSASRNRAIRAEFNGRNYDDLARRYGLTTRWVREIVAGGLDGQRTPDQKPADRQLPLF